MSKKQKRIVFFGDSITEAGVQPGGYITMLGDSLKLRKSKYDLIGAGIGGNKVYDLYLRHEEDVLARKPDQVFIYVGVNDVWHKATHRTGTDPDKFKKFYAALIKRMQAKKIKVVLCTPACIGEKKNNENAQDSDLNQYSAIIRALAAETRSELVDLRALFTAYQENNNPSNADRGVLTTDGVHLNAEGNRRVASAMLEKIR